MKKVKKAIKEPKINNVSDDKWNTDEYTIIMLILIMCFGFGNLENPRINELEKKVARLEGQMSMIGGKSL